MFLGRAMAPKKKKERKRTLAKILKKNSCIMHFEGVLQYTTFDTKIMLTLGGAEELYLAPGL